MEALKKSTEKPLGYQLEADGIPSESLPIELLLGERLLFETRDAALSFAEANGIKARAITPKTRYETEKPIIVDREGQPLHVAVTWPWSQNLFDKEGFREHSELINYPGSEEDYGGSAYKVETHWLFSLDIETLEKIEVMSYLTPFDETGNYRNEN